MTSKARTSNVQLRWMSPYPEKLRFRGDLGPPLLSGRATPLQWEAVGSSRGVLEGSLRPSWLPSWLPSSQASSRQPLLAPSPSSPSPSWQQPSWQQPSSWPWPSLSKDRQPHERKLDKNSFSQNGLSRQPLLA